MQLRRGAPEDSDRVAGVWWRARLAAVPAIPRPVHPEHDVRAWFADVVLPSREVWVAEDEGVVVGVLVLDDEWVDQLYLEPGWTGRGIGSRLIELAKRARPSHLSLWTFQANVGARRFYERHGFVATATTDGDNEEGAPDVRYDWPGAAVAE